MNPRECSDAGNRAEEAARQFRKADRLQHKPPIDFSEMTLNPLRAEQAREKGQSLLKPPANLTGRPTMELVPTPDAEEPLTQTRMEFLETLNKPTVISVAASEQRAQLATSAGVLPSAIDAAVTAGAEGSIEKMLCHQLAAAHAAGMTLMGELQDDRGDLPPVEVARLTNAAARLFEVFQAGTAALQRLKMGNTQRVVVQYQQQVTVETGGNALVAGRMAGASRRRRKLRNGK